MKKKYDFIEPKSQELLQFQEMLKSESLCFEDLNEVSVLKIQLDTHHRIKGGFGLEIFGKNALLRSVVVSREFRGSGKGTEIVKKALESAKLHGVDHLFLLTTTADKFFLRFGFKVIQRTSVPDAIGNTTEFKTFCPDTAVCMKYEI